MDVFYQLLLVFGQ